MKDWLEDEKLSDLQAPEKEEENVSAVEVLSITRYLSMCLICFRFLDYPCDPNCTAEYELSCEICSLDLLLCGLGHSFRCVLVVVAALLSRPIW